MKEALKQSLDNLRTNKLRSFLTMFGIMWGVISIVILSAMGEGFQRGNQAVLEELGKNIVVIRNGRTSMQAGGERAGRVIRLEHRRRVRAPEQVAAHRASQSGADARRRVDQERLQRRVASDERHLARVSGHPHDRGVARPSDQRGGQRRSAPRRRHRPRSRHPAVRRSESRRRSDEAERPHATRSSGRSGRSFRTRVTAGGTSCGCSSLTRRCGAIFR